jgi:hypothetical protein
MVVRVMRSAFLPRGSAIIFKDHVLLITKSNDRIYAHGAWAGDMLASRPTRSPIRSRVFLQPPMRAELAGWSTRTQ